MTDREAIRTLADIVADLCYRAEMPMSKAVCEEIRRNAAPTAPAVTREQAIRLRTICEMELRRMEIDIPDKDEMPVFFRAVADKLEGE